MIPFNKPCLTGKETQYIEEAARMGKLSGNGVFTQRCQAYFEHRYGFKKTLLTTSCTDALEMCAMLADIKAGDEVIVPGYTFVSTAVVFVRQGAKIVFADSCREHPNIDAEAIENLITPRTKAIVPVHYAGVACDMDTIMALAEKYNLIVIEDAAQAIDSYYKGRPLGTIGHLSAFSFHETKNISAGEGGLLGINDERFVQRAEIIWEKGTNRAEFFRGETHKYQWVDIGSSFLPSEITAAFLWAQLENIAAIQAKRLALWEVYYTGLKDLEDKGQIKLPQIPHYATHNGHLFYITPEHLEARDKLIAALRNADVYAVFHYISLHSSPFYSPYHDGRQLPNSDFFTNTLVRLPLFFDLEIEDIRTKILPVIRQLYA
jgi:dTDP-4-amino-4,6-dideoxygalactose transaminase